MGVLRYEYETARSERNQHSMDKRFDPDNRMAAAGPSPNSVMVVKPCKHIQIAHCGSTYMCLNCGVKGQVIKDLWEGAAR
ncbi:hypothetical protein LCGC14_1897810 [marine sediment metagenome]|uniref:Uncharacterized protein n=1 Tax=marine sediment metagenome TaxID=412755 RepID=A0A0F9IVH5_9ZZZZ